jgi:hypothetical protein
MALSRFISASDFGAMSSGDGRAMLSPRPDPHKGHGRETRIVRSRNPRVNYSYFELAVKTESAELILQRLLAIETLLFGMRSDRH